MKKHPSSLPNSTFTKDAGITILELLIALVIIGLIASVTTVQVMGYFGRAQSNVAQLQLDKLRFAVKIYQIDTGELPSQDDLLTPLLRNVNNVEGWSGPYVGSEKEIKDPWQSYIKIDTSLEQNEFRLLSSGPNNTFGDDDDVSS